MEWDHAVHIILTWHTDWAKWFFAQAEGASAEQNINIMYKKNSAHDRPKIGEKRKQKN